MIKTHTYSTGQGNFFRKKKTAGKNKSNSRPKPLKKLAKESLTAEAAATIVAVSPYLTAFVSNENVVMKISKLYSTPPCYNDSKAARNKKIVKPKTNLLSLNHR